MRKWRIGWHPLLKPLWDSCRSKCKKPLARAGLPSERMENIAKPDFKTGFPIDDLPDGGMILGQADAEDVMLARRGDELFALGAACTHYHGPLAEGERICVEHWVVAERQGQVAARNILGYHEPFNAVPFFWSQHYDIAINYVGYAEKWEAIEIDGELDARNCAVTYKGDNRTLAAATISRDLQSLQIEAAMEASAGENRLTAANIP